MQQYKEATAAATISNGRSTVRYNDIRTHQKPMHPYHQVDGSPWPIQMSIAILGLALSIVNIQVTKEYQYIFPSQILIIIIASLWWRDVIREGKGGYHTRLVQKGILIGFQLFQITEIMLFEGFFWSHFHSALAPAVDQGSTWPPIGIHSVNQWAIPLFGSCVLLASGFVLTLAHHATIAGNKDLALLSLFYTVLLGLLFIYLQANEYYYGEFTISDSVYGTVFYMTTGLHGLHVIVGVLFLFVNLIRIYSDSFTTEHHFGYEASIFYWHLVDVVWLFVFVSYYCWGGIQWWKINFTSTEKYEELKGCILMILWCT